MIPSIESSNGKTKHAPVVGTTYYPHHHKGTLPFNGGNSAYIRELYVNNPFDTTINQTNFRDILYEEEFCWPRKLAMCGSVISVNANYTDIHSFSFAEFLIRTIGNSFVGHQKEKRPSSC